MDTNNISRETDKMKFGRIGEDIAEIFLSRKGFSVIARNYRKKWGEIDIVAREKRIMVFVEVKTEKLYVPRVTSVDGIYSIEENIHRKKIDRLTRTIRSYLLENNVSDETEWRLDALIVRLDTQNRVARVRHIKNVNVG